VADVVRSLSDDEVKQIALVIESLDRSTFDFLQVELGDLKLTVGKGPPPAVGSAPVAAPAAAPPVWSAVAAAPAAPVAASAPIAAPAPVAAPPAPSVAPAPAPAAEAADTVAIVAPLLGRFYAQPEPGAAPFVSLGSVVTEDTTVGLIEVMKTFNAATAGVRGVIAQICVADSQLVEYGQVLFRVRPTT
jgi:acetyl-CoA carboxylase biotin carboxyl carrier protein